MRSQKCVHIFSGSIFLKVMGKKQQILKRHLVAPPGDPGSNPAGLQKSFFQNLFFLLFLGPGIQSIVSIAPKRSNLCNFKRGEGEILSNLDRLRLMSVYVCRISAI